jgi:DNA-directed RNA polymerase sigma subunit (sigma70/sigma32)
MRTPIKPCIDTGLDRLIARARYGEPMEVEEIALECRCSRQNIQQILAVAIRKVRQRLIADLRLTPEQLRDEF